MGVFFFFAGLSDGGGHAPSTPIEPILVPSFSHRRTSTSMVFLERPFFLPSRDLTAGRTSASLISAMRRDNVLFFPVLLGLFSVNFFNDLFLSPPL